MKITGDDFAGRMLGEDAYLFKLVMNESAIHFFPHSMEHRDMNVNGLNYQDDSVGNALAGMIRPGRIEFRRHKSFSDERIEELCRRFFSLPGGQPFAGFQVWCQGRRLIGLDP